MLGDAVVKTPRTRRALEATTGDPSPRPTLFFLSDGIDKMLVLAARAPYNRGSTWSQQGTESRPSRRSARQREPPSQGRGPPPCTTHTDTTRMGPAYPAVLS